MLAFCRPLSGCIQQWVGIITSGSTLRVPPWCMHLASNAHNTGITGTKDHDNLASTSKGPEPLHSLIKVALVGRPNVGKSALFNRLIGRRVALVHDTPESHVTRDWREGQARVGDLNFTVVDTCGVEPMAPVHTIQGRGTALTGQMLRSATLALLVIDAREGVIGPDEDLARWLSIHVPKNKVLLVANKAENSKAQQAMEQTVADCYRLGFGDPVAVSAATGEGMADLYVALQPHVDAMTERVRDRIAQIAGRHLQQRDTEAERSEDAEDVWNQRSGPEEGATNALDDLHEQDKPVRVTIVGLPNVGKSTLLNRLLGEERCVTGPEPGLTRDPVLATWVHKGRTIELVDTPGYVGQTKVAWYDDVDGEVATKARQAGLGALASSHVVVLVVDAAAAVKTQKVLNSRELSLVSQVIEEGKSLVLVANKMDVMPGAKEKNMYLSTLRKRLDERLKDAGQIAVVEMSAQIGKGVNKLMPIVLEAHACWSARVGTGQLNRWLKEDVRAKFAEGGGISTHVQRIKYITQVKSSPPTYACFVAGYDPLPDDVHAFMASQLRNKFDMRSTPIRFWFRYRNRTPAGQFSKRRRIRLRKPALPSSRPRPSSTSSSSSIRHTIRAHDGDNEGDGDREGGSRVSPREFMRQRAEAAAQEKTGLSATQTKGKRVKAP